jgi:hypothetical protein
LEILLYITDLPERVISGKPLALNLPNDEKRQQFLALLAETLEANVIHLENGDHMVVRKDR